VLVREKIRHARGEQNYRFLRCGFQKLRMICGWITVHGQDYVCSDFLVKFHQYIPFM
jgi:hypothetical protein